MKKSPWIFIILIAINTIVLTTNCIGIKMTNNTDNQDSGNSVDSKTEDILLRTIKSTGQANARLMEVLMLQQKTNERSHSLQEDFYKTQQEALKKENRYRRFKRFALISPIVITVIMLLFSAVQEYLEYSSSEGYVAQVTISGMIQQGSSTAGADSVIASLRKAFSDNEAKGVLIRISSPGGSPTQSHLIHDEIVRLRELHPDKKVKLIGEEFLTSGAYWIASAVPDIAVVNTTYIGSIGVISTQFNFSGVIEKLGVERLVITSGESKSRLDQFLPPKEKDLQKMRDISTSIHEAFMDTIIASRGDKLKAKPADLFTGDFWMGHQAVELGLADEVTTPTRLMLREFGTVRYLDYSKRPSFVESIGLAQFSAALVNFTDILTGSPSIKVEAR